MSCVSCIGGQVGTATVVGDSVHLSEKSSASSHSFTVCMNVVNTNNNNDKNNKNNITFICI